MQYAFIMYSVTLIDKHVLTSRGFQGLIIQQIINQIAHGLSLGAAPQALQVTPTLCHLPQESLTPFYTSLQLSGVKLGFYL